MRGPLEPRVAGKNLPRHVPGDGKQIIVLGKTRHLDLGGAGLSLSQQIPLVAFLQVELGDLDRKSVV